MNSADNLKMTELGSHTLAMEISPKGLSCWVLALFTPPLAILNKRRRKKTNLAILQRKLYSANCTTTSHIKVKTARVMLSLTRTDISGDHEETGIISIWCESLCLWEVGLDEFSCSILPDRRQGDGVAFLHC